MGCDFQIAGQDGAIRILLERLLSSVQRRQRSFGGSVQHLEQRLGGASWAAFSLFPVADGLQRHLDPPRKFGLAQAQAFSDPAGKIGRILNRVSLIGGLLDSNFRRARRIYPRRANAPHGLKDHLNMVNNGIAAAYKHRKLKINTLKKGDIVFLYERRVGIVGMGRASGQLEIKDYGQYVNETHQQKLTDYKLVKPLSASEIKKLTGTNMPYLHIMFKVTEKDGALIEKKLLTR